MPLVVGGWLLGPRIGLGLTAAAIALRILGISIGSVDPTTGAIQCIVALAVGLLTVVAGSASLARSQAGQLRRSAAHSSELEAAKREFLLLASHELRSPLAVARGYAAMLSDGSLGAPPDRFRRPLDVLRGKLDEINALVEEMLETARLETGELGLIHGDVDLRDVIANAADAVGPAVTERHHIELELPGRPVLVRGDGERLRRIAFNLLDNAVKYSPGGGQVTAAVTVVDATAHLSVCDEGVGIAVADTPRMFQRFGRIVTEQTRSIPGTGLGLYLCRELARAHGGDITVESREGEGSTFTLSLPATATLTPGAGFPGMPATVAGAAPPAANLAGRSTASPATKPRAGAVDAGLRD
ncbi:MAG TPA: HAMP domain-containing sensor histidine kinase [Candidatus Dormibacteraeota bacterium]|nr:HAMP domain-containing sensor histidine kinase [Candidatus Dormibacteraeota bacterium]